MIRSKNQLIITFTVAVLGSLLYFYFDPSLNNFFPPCPFYFATSLYCPGCGSQRAFHALLHGDLFKASGHNLLFVLFLPVVSFSAAVLVNNLFNTRKLAQHIFHSVLFVKIVLVIVLSFWILRNIPVWPFAVLAP